MKTIIESDRDDRCFLCGRGGRMEVHHMIHGTAGRKMADANGLTVHLCMNCHRQLHDKGTGDRELQRLAQETWERRYVRIETDREYRSMDARLRELPMIARQAWIATFGKSYK